MAARSRPRRCRVVLPSGKPCCELNDYTLFNHLDELYAARLSEVEKSSDSKKVLCVLREWNQDLRIIYKQLVCAVRQLESEAEKRVEANHKLCSQNEKHNKEVKKLSEELCAKKKQIKYLEDNIATLKELLESRQGQITDLMDDLSKCKLSTNECQECEDKLLSLEYCTDKLKAELETNKEKLCMKEKTIEDLNNQLAQLKEQSRVRDSNPECKCSKKERRMQKDNSCRQQVSQCEEESDKMQVNEEFDKEIEALKKLLEEQKASEVLKDEEIKSLRESLLTLRMTTREMQEALTLEVAEKHDTLLSLRREMAQLEEQIRQSDMQTQFKDDIIKGLRKEVKIARAKPEESIMENHEDSYQMIHVETEYHSIEVCQRFFNSPPASVQKTKSLQTDISYGCSFSSSSTKSVVSSPCI